jgi:hypothetical protein
VSADKDKSSVFTVKNVHIKVDTLKLSIRDSEAKESENETRIEDVSETYSLAGCHSQVTLQLFKVNRATEREDAASSGKDWRSEAYVHSRFAIPMLMAMLTLHRRFAIVN